MRKVSALAIVASLLAAPTFALTISDVDTDGDSLISFDEMAVSYPDLTEDTFAEVDTSGDSFVDETELSAALEAGTIEASIQ